MCSDTNKKAQLSIVSMSAVDDHPTKTSDCYSGDMGDVPRAGLDINQHVTVFMDERGYSCLPQAEMIARPSVGTGSFLKNNACETDCPPPRTGNEDIGIPDGDESDCSSDTESDSDQDRDDNNSYLCSQMGCLKSGTLMTRLNSMSYYEAHLNPQVLQTTSHRRRIHPKKDISESLRVSFDELVSVKEVRRYNCTDMASCFYTASEIRNFRAEFILGINNTDDGIIDVMQDTVDSICEFVTSLPSRLCGQISS